MAPIQVALVGVGLSGQVFHAPMVLALPDFFHLHTVVERNPKSPRGTIGDKFKVDVKIVRTVEEVLQDQEIELIIIGTPSFTHYDIAKAALLAGKHVLVDKPVTTTLQEARDLWAVAKTQNKLLCGYQNRRWDSDYLTLRKLIADGRLGDVIDFESHFDRYSPKLKGNWKDEVQPGNGLVFDLGSHLIDQALQLFGRPESLTAFTSRLRSGYALDDAFTILLHYNQRQPYPLNVTLRGHVLTIRDPQVRYIVRGSKGTFTKYGVDPQEQRLRDGDSISNSRIGVEPKELHGNLEAIDANGSITHESIESLSGCYLEFYRNVYAAVRKGEALAVAWGEAAQVIELIELAHQSASEGKTLPLSSFSL